jgi:hypothetical protein
MGEDDVEVLGFAERNPDPNAWDMPISYKGNCRIGCKSRAMLGTRNLLTALRWADYHREGSEHVEKMLKRREPPKTPGFDGVEGTEWEGGKAR